MKMASPDTILSTQRRVASCSSRLPSPLPLSSFQQSPKPQAGLGYSTGAYLQSSHRPNLAPVGQVFLHSLSFSRRGRRHSLAAVFHFVNRRNTSFPLPTNQPTSCPPSFLVRPCDLPSPVVINALTLLAIFFSSISNLCLLNVQ